MTHKIWGKGSMDVGIFTFIVLFLSIVLYSIVFGVMGDMGSMNSLSRILILVSPALAGILIAWLLLKRRS